MWRLTLSNALAHRGRLALTWLAVALGVAFVAGSLVLTDTSSRVLDDQFRTAAAGVDLTVRAAAAFDSAMGVEVQRDPLPADLPEPHRRRPRGRVASAPSPPVPGQLQVARHSDRAARARPCSVPGPRPRSPRTRCAPGTPPPAPDEVVLDAATARAHQITLGDTVTVVGHRQPRSCGSSASPGSAPATGWPTAPWCSSDLPTAQALLGLGTADQRSRGDRRRRRRRTRPAHRARRRRSARRTRSPAARTPPPPAPTPPSSQVSYLRVVLLALAGAGLVVGAFLIANTFGIVLTQRSRELALLRAAGATGRQVLASVLGEALLVGLTGAAAARPRGRRRLRPARAGRRRRARPADGALTVDRPRPCSSPSPRAPSSPSLAALGPARRAARVAPVEAMRASDPAPHADPPQPPGHRVGAGSAAAAAAAAGRRPPRRPRRPGRGRRGPAARRRGPARARSSRPGWPAPSAARWTGSVSPGGWPAKSHRAQPAPHRGHRHGAGARPGADHLRGRLGSSVKAIAASGGEAITADH